MEGDCFLFFRGIRMLRVGFKRGRRISKAFHRLFCMENKASNIQAVFQLFSGLLEGWANGFLQLLVFFSLRDTTLQLLHLASVLR